MARPGNIPFLFGIRGISALYVMAFHLNYMVLGFAFPPCTIASPIGSATAISESPRSS
jgi:peptidoglycan/LPS O-acetylase OafA/YrhL